MGRYPADPALSAVQSRSRHHPDGDVDDADEDSDNDGKSQRTRYPSHLPLFPTEWMESY